MHLSQNIENYSDRESGTKQVSPGRHTTLHWCIWRGEHQAIGYQSLISFCSSVTERIWAIKQTTNICTFIKHWFGQTKHRMPPHCQCFNVSGYGYHTSLNMKAIFFLLFVFLPPALTEAQQNVLIRQIRIVDVEKGKLSPVTSVLVRDGFIKKIGSQLTAPVNTTIVDGTNKYLMPGLWDMHVHTTDTAEAYYNWPLFVANGVTGVRDMGGNGIVALNRSKALIHANKAVAPRLFGAGNILDGKPLIHPDQRPIEIRSEQDVKRFVDSMVVGKADFIKAYEMLSRENFIALLSYAKQKGKKVVGHVPMTVNVEEAANLGMHSMEHLRGFDYSFSTKTDSIVLAQAFRVDTATGSGRTLRGRIIQSRIPVAFNSFDSLKAVRLLRLLRDKNICQTPTLIVGNSLWFVYRFDTTQAFKDQLRHMPPRRVRLWDSLYRMQPPSSLDQIVVKSQFRTVKMMAEQGVPLLAGTDVHNPYLIPGYSLQQELVLLQMAGVPSSTILKAATLNAAASLGLQKLAGTVAVGKWADLLLLSANPLEEISNTQRIEGVFLKGDYYSKKALVQLLKNVEEKHKTQNR